MSSSLVARLKHDIEEKQKASEITSLDAHYRKLRDQRERERKQIEIAKKMAARFNLTYRAMEFDAAKRAEAERIRSLKAKQDAKRLASKFNMTFRALKMTSTGTPKGKVNVGLDRLHKRDHDDDDDDDGGIVDDFAKVSAAAKKKSESSTTTTTTTTTAASSTSEPGSPHDVFFNPELAAALHANDQTKIDLALVKSFLEQHDPKRAGEADLLLLRYKGREEQLMKDLLAQYPPEAAEGDHAQVEEALMIVASAGSGEAALPSALKSESERRRPVSTRAKGITLSVRFEDGVKGGEVTTPGDAGEEGAREDLSSPHKGRNDSLVVLDLSAAEAGEGGYILSGVHEDDAVTFNTLNAKQQAILRERMRALKHPENIIEAVVAGEKSEFL